MITIKEYAISKGCSYEAIRKQVVRYKNELGDNVIVDGRTQYLNDVAISFLDTKRANKTVVVYDNNIKKLEEDNKKLLIKITELQNSLLIEKDKVKELQEMTIKLIEQSEGIKIKKKWWGKKKPSL